MALQEFVKVYTAESNFTGIQGYISVPATPTGLSTYDFVNFFLALDDYYEVGLSYADKGDGNGPVWRYFANHAKFRQQNQIVSPTSEVFVKIVNRGTEADATVQDGRITFSRTAAVASPTYSGKMLIGGEDNSATSSSGYTPRHPQVTFRNVKVQRGGVWLDWNATTQGSLGALVNRTPQYQRQGMVIQNVPLIAQLT